jgi:hypothetical protein
VFADGEGEPVYTKGKPSLKIGTYNTTGQKCVSMATFTLVAQFESFDQSDLSTIIGQMIKIGLTV